MYIYTKQEKKQKIAISKNSVVRPRYDARRVFACIRGSFALIIAALNSYYAETDSPRL